MNRLIRAVSKTPLRYMIIEKMPKLLYLTDWQTSITCLSRVKHGINLRHGRTNPGTGDCAFEAIIYNINERQCFKEKFLMSIDWYRRIWVTDMANRTVHSPYNTLENAEDWLSGWSEMLIPGTYERGIYGDLRSSQ